MYLFLIACYSIYLVLMSVCDLLCIVLTIAQNFRFPTEVGAAFRLLVFIAE